MSKLIRGFLERLRDRLTASFASLIGSTFTTFRTIHQVEQQSQLEDLARQYEADGKHNLAEQLRVQATRLNLDDPVAEAEGIVANVCRDGTTPHALEQSDSAAGRRTDKDSGRTPTKSKSNRRKRNTSASAPDLGVNLD